MDFGPWLDQLTNGFVLGNIYALLAAGLALIFGVAHLINFAHGSIYMAGAYTGWVLTAKLGLPLYLALPAAAAVGAVLGLVVQWLAVRPFQKSSPMAPLLATLGLGMILDSLSELVFSPNPQSFPDLIPTFRFNLGGVSLGVLDVVIVAVTAFCALFLFLFLQFSRPGRALRAAAQDPEAALQVGIRVGRVHAWAFALASALGALAGVLIGLYYNTLSPSMGFQAGLKGFTACVLGGLGNVPAAMAGGLVLGIGESLGVGIFGSSARALVTFSLLLLALFLRPQGLFGHRRDLAKEPLTGTFLAPRPPVRVPWPLGTALGLAAGLLPLVWADPYILQILSSGWIYALFAVSLTFLAGTAGVMSLGQAGLMALGAYASALAMTKLGWPFEAAFPLAGLTAAALGTLLSLPALKLKGHYIAIATLALGEIVSQGILNGGDLTGGPLGIAGIPAPTVFGWTVQSASDFYWLNLAILAAGAALTFLVIRSPFGLTLRGIREDEKAARALGINPGGYRAAAFAFSGFLAGLAGALTAHMYSYINHETFNSSFSILGLTMVILGGLGNLWGAVLGALGLVALPEVLRPVAEFRWLAYGALLILILKFRPQGILGTR